MCSLQPSGDPVKDEVESAVASLCIKCKQLPPTINIRFAVYCDTCFLEQTFHKYRTAVGKSRKRSEREHVLLYLDNRSASKVLLLIAGQVLKEDSDRKHLDRFSAVTFHENLENLVSKDLNIPFYCLSVEDDEASSSAAQDLLIAKKMKMISDLAVKIQADKVYLPDTCNTLATTVFKLIIKGMGDIVPWELQIVKRLFSMNIVLPLREHHQLEIREYLKLHDIIEPHTLCAPSGLNNLTQSFMDMLDQDYSATVSTVTKTAGKVMSDWSTSPESYGECSICGVPTRQPSLCYSCETNLVEFNK